MLNTRSVAAAATTLFALSNALVLQDIPHSDGLKYSKRGDPLGCLDLQSQETFLWGAEDETQAALGNLTVYMPGLQENILSMERFNGMLTSVNCSDTTIDMAFKDDDTFAYAKAVWDWVNGEEDNSFVMVAERGACGWNPDNRQPFTVSTLTYDEAANVAHLNAVPKDWTDAIHSYTLNVGGLPPQHTQKRAEHSRDLALDFNHQFPVETVNLPLPDGVTATLDMSNCSTSGQFVFQFTLETTFLIPTKAEISVRPQDVAVTVAPSLHLTGDITEPRTGDLTLLRLNLAGIQIPLGILDIGPEIVLSVGATVGPLQGEATIEAGVVYSLDNAAIASLSIFDVEADQSGWTPIVRESPLTVSADLSGSVKAFVKAEFELAAKAFGVGYDIGIGIAPFIATDMQTVSAESGQCGTSEGLALNPSYGADLILDAHTPSHGEDDPLFAITLATVTLPLPPTCLPFENAAIDAASAPEEPTTTAPALPAASSDPVVAVISSAPALAVSSSAPAVAVASSVNSAPSVISSASAISSPLSSAAPVLSSKIASSAPSAPASSSVAVYASSTFSTAAISSTASAAPSAAEYNGHGNGYNHGHGYGHGYGRY